MKENEGTELPRSTVGVRMTLPPLPVGADSWKLYYEYQSPVGRDPWRWHHRIIWRVLMYFHERAERLWHWVWDTAQPFQEPSMRYETKHKEMKVVRHLTLDAGRSAVCGADSPSLTSFEEKVTCPECLPKDEPAND